MTAKEHETRRSIGLGIAALGVVYGDIGTSPLYTLKECFNPAHGVRLSEASVLGVLSLIFWSLVVVVGVKYLIVLMRADNDGDGGIMALLTLAVPGARATSRRSVAALVFLGLFGTALLWADGMITPAISVLGAIEGMEVATPALAHLVVPVALLILVPLFLLQKRGTAGVGALFGPLMLVWFTVLAASGLPWIVKEPRVLAALSPHRAVFFLSTHGHAAILVLGAVVLCITGSEALYADMGHFGASIIRRSWFLVAFPALLLNYFGQGALLLARGEDAASSPFYTLVPEVLLIPLLLLATAAAVVASQAMISGAFSLARQAVQLGYLPRLTIVHTSAEARGQIYVPEVNVFLMVACIGLVLGFRSTSRLAAAYGISVVGSMVATSILLYSVTRQRWGWSRWPSGLMVGAFLFIELVYLAGNGPKLAHGAWFPVASGTILFTIMTTWKRGRAILRAQIGRRMLPAEEFVESLKGNRPHRVKGVGVFLTANVEGVPHVLLHHLKHNKVLHEKVILLTVQIEDQPVVSEKKRLSVEDLGEGVYRMVAHFGFIESPRIPPLFARTAAQGLTIDLSHTSYYMGRETLLISGRTHWPRWQKHLFAFLSRNARPTSTFFHIPPNRVVEIGAQLEL